MGAVGTGVFAALTDEELEFLRQGYDEQAMMISTREALGRMHPEVAAPLAAMVDAVYTADPDRKRERERCLITLLTGHHPAEFAIHVYWGLMVGLTAADIQQVLLITFAYNGVACYTVSLLAVKRTVEILKAQVQAARGPAEASAPMSHRSAAVVGALLGAFWGN